MKKFYLVVAVLALATAWGIVDLRTHAQANEPIVASAELVSPNIVISQFQPGTAAVANDEYIELHNIGAAAVDLSGYVVVYRSASGSTDVGPMAQWSTSTIVQPGQYYLIASTSYTGTATPDITYNNTSCACSLSATSGGLAIRQGPTNTGTVIDAVGWGTATNIFFEGTRTAAPGSGNSQARVSQGCQDTDSNVNDFATLIPFAPRNTATTPYACIGGGTTLFAAISANPTTVSPGSSTLLTVTVLPATTPPSTGITVVADLSGIGGSATQSLFDDGTNGDIASGDNVFSFIAPIPVGTAGGAHSITAVASDAQARSVNLNQGITVSAPLPDEDPLLFGNPSNATSDVANENNYLMQKPQYAISYNRSKGEPNWVAWRLDSSWIGGASRQNDYRPDPALPAGWYAVTDSDYSGSGYDRGHMCPSGDRTRSVTDNSATFLMTNFVPQLAANNQGPWEDFETYCRTLASQGNEIYIIDGPVGSIGTIASGHVVIPDLTWKVVLVLPNGSNDLQRVTRNTRAFGIVVPNHAPVVIGDVWRTYRVTVDQVERLTGYNFFSTIPKITQEMIERRRDRQ
jgi:endonuclease G